MLDKKSVLREQRVFAANFKAARQTMGLTQKDIAEASDLRQNQISDFERNVAGIGLESMIALSHAIRIPLHLLINPNFHSIFDYKTATKLWIEYQKKAGQSAVPYERQLFARNFKAARIQANLTQVAISERCGFASESLSSIERAEKTVYLSTAIRLASAVQVPIHILLSPEI
jgi:transcriptional regulator with XRE-family HTH domain